jgi:hypothetical protein
MKYIKFLCVFSAIIIFLCSCSLNQAESTIPPVLNMNPTALPSAGIETAYPYANNIGPASSDTSAIETAYPSIVYVNTPLAEGILPAAPQDAQEPVEGMAAISGVLYLGTTRQVLTDTQYFLLPIKNTTELASLATLVAPDAERGDIIGKSDGNGVINLDNVPPGKYYLAVWAHMNWYLAQVSDQDTTPLVLDLNTGESIPLGVIYITYH